MEPVYSGSGLLWHRASQTFSVSSFSGDVEQVEGAAKITIRIFKSITLIHDAGTVLLEVCGSGLWFWSVVLLRLGSVARRRAALALAC